MTPYSGEEHKFIYLCGSTLVEQHCRFDSILYYSCINTSLFSCRIRHYEVEKERQIDYILS